jgi:TldD protein
MRRATLRLSLPFLVVLALAPGMAPRAAGTNSGQTGDVLLQAMQQELHRAFTALSKSDPAPYFLSYSAFDQDMASVVASSGGLLASVHFRRRQADVTMRVGSAVLDNTHDGSRGSGMESAALPLDDDKDAIARVLWQLTDREYKQAAPALLRVKTDTAVRSEEEDKSPDFSKETPQTHVNEARADFSFNQHAWDGEVRRLSAGFNKYPEVYTSLVALQVGRTRSYFVSSEGGSLVDPGRMVRLIIEAETRADDGMELLRVETFQAPTPDQLPREAALAAKIEKMAADLKALRAAPLAEPFAGPALLSGRAAAVFFHEVLGHRLEGHRQRDENEGQTFTKKVNQQVLPEFLTVVDDPTQRELGGVALAGAYAYDDEGVPASRVVAIQDGILKNFLTSRMPIKNFDRSNGHGRRQAGLMPTGRQGNLIVTSTRAVKDSDLRAKLIEEVKKQGKPYGLYFEDIQGGFTLTTRELPQSFQVLPVMVWRVYPDGRPDEFVRGVDIVGTPLAALNRILLTGETQQVFNGVCGAESGNIPVSAVAPGMLFSEMEVQKRAHSRSRPPILPPPGFENPPPSSKKPAPEGKRP